MPDVIFRPATHADEQPLLRMMRILAEQEPGAYFFDEPAVREVLRKFLAGSELGQAWLFYQDETPVGYMILTFGYSFEYHGRDSFIDELRNIGGRELASAPCNLSKSAPSSSE